MEAFEAEGDSGSSRSLTRCVRGRARKGASARSRDVRTPAGPPAVGDGEDLALVGLDGPEAELVAYCCAFRSSCAVELLDLVEAPRRDLLKQAAGALASRDRGRRLALLGRLLAPVWSEGGRRRLELALSEEPAWLASLAVPLVPGGARGRGGAPLPSACRAHPALTGLARRFVLRLLGG